MWPLSSFETKSLDTIKIKAENFEPNTNQFEEQAGRKLMVQKIKQAS